MLKRSVFEQFHPRPVTVGTVRSLLRKWSAMGFSLRALQTGLALLTISLLGTSACREQTSAQQGPLTAPQSQTDLRSSQIAAEPALELESEGDRVIRRELDTVIEQDTALKGRAIRFTVDNGDVTATGIVRTETERQAINELAMRIAKVKSVANAVRVSPVRTEGGIDGAGAE